jgi:uncharacterized protein (TIRG00374 family)
MKSIKLKQTLTIAFTTIIIVFMILFITPEKFLDSLVSIPLEIIIILVILVIADMLARTVRWWILLIAQNSRVPLTSLINPMLSSSFLNVIFPARAGEIVRLYSLKKNNDIPYSAGLSVIVVEQVVNLLSLVLVATLALGSIFLSGTSLSNEIAEQLLPLGLLGFISGLIGITLLFIIDPIKFKFLFSFLPENIQEKGIKLLKQLSIGLNSLRGNILLLSSALGVSMLVWIFEGIMIWLLATEIISQSSEFSVSLFASTMGNITFIFPILPGAVGQYEIVLALVLTISQYYDPELGGAATIPLIDRIIKTVVLAIIGGYATLALGVKDIFREEQEELDEIATAKKEEIDTQGM